MMSKLSALAISLCRSQLHGAVGAKTRPSTSLPYSPSLDRFLDGSRGRSLHRLLPLLLRIVDQEQSHPARPGALERVFKTRYGEPALLVGHSANKPRKPSATRSTVETEIGDYFAACMDEARARKPARRRSERISTKSPR